MRSRELYAAHKYRLGLQQSSADIPLGSAPQQKLSFWHRIHLAQAEGGGATASAAKQQAVVDERVIEEVRVTASRQEENLQDVAVAVTVIDQAESLFGSAVGSTHRRRHCARELRIALR